ncbi:hypothetical protein [Rhodococcus pyridinivorans]|uniref:hypothetical protein n=1 Tax=Rhodococcus pyridinivorans TaxID=103816 RepID=UPI0022837A4B|nr:hypothetical protein [Rhodococcus pyridinivorans]WAL49340.1 hypothetical protein OQN32_24610 [Rhodococcus pyridinivorans]
MPIPPIIEAVLQTHYRLLRAPLAVLEQHLPHDRAQGLPVRSACRQVLIMCDRTAAHVLHDESAAGAADRLERHYTADRHAHARQQHARDRQNAAVLDRHRRRFLDRHYRSGYTSPPEQRPTGSPTIADTSDQHR